MKNTLNLVLPEECAGMRLDVALSQYHTQYSRGTWQRYIKSGAILVEGVPVKPKRILQGETTLSLLIDESETIQTAAPAEPIPLDIVYEDNAFIVLNKPAGLVVHPGAGHAQGTLLNALLHHAPQLAQLPRAGIIHRIDKDTTGLLVISKTQESHHSLVDQLAARTFSRQYLALVEGQLIAGATIDQPIGRHPTKRTQMACAANGRHAVTHYRVKEKFAGVYTLLDVRLETGRTHQIRVHLAHAGHPLVGDVLYGRGLRFPKQASENLIAALQQFRRQALHACELGFIHPETLELVHFSAPLPDDFAKLLSVFREEYGK